ncbi:hypothetical protein FGG79_06240 [Bacillus sp. BHET2]|uniref:hypothetical protein n=1 Tax=Bacillus sp. BHET2 TaxID=2583818 RepID=UPI00110E0309|nr:hypothetical protein [Bacillus sp. BHET2]TMU87711.1 hypothetical protein FGG79_06240 [Bacillus sp. BHET2]
MKSEEGQSILGEGHSEVLHDIHSISYELESLYNHYSRRIKNVSEELSRERTKHKIYQFEIAENHYTIQTLTEQIEYLLQEVEVKHELYLQLQQYQREKVIQDDKGLTTISASEMEVVKDDLLLENSLWEMTESLPPATIPEIRVIYESTRWEKKSQLENVKNDVISLLIEVNRFFVSNRDRSIYVEKYNDAFFTHLEWIQVKRKKFSNIKRDRWYTTVWRFLWGKEDENNHPEILKKLDLIEQQLVSYSTTFNEVKKALDMGGEREETTQGYLKKMGALHEQLKKIEGYYEEELETLKNQLEDFKQREIDLERQVNLLNEKGNSGQKVKSQREVEMEQELDSLRKDLQSQSNKKNELYNKMKQQSTITSKKPQRNAQFEEYGSIPMDSDSKRTMFNPNKYIR